MGRNGVPASELRWQWPLLRGANIWRGRLQQCGDSDHGRNISSLEDGDLFYFRSNFTNTAAEVMVNIDGTGQHDIRINNRQNNGDEALPAGYMRGDVYYFLVWDADNSHFSIWPALTGTAIFRNIGNREHEIPLLGASGIFDRDRIPNNIQAYSSTATYSRGSKELPSRITTRTGYSSTSAARSAAAGTTQTRSLATGSGCRRVWPTRSSPAVRTG